MKLLKHLYGIHSPSNHEADMMDFITDYASCIKGTTIEEDKTGNIYITKGLSDTYPCVVAHTDQVQKLHSNDFKAIEAEGIIFGWSESDRSMQGLGADDKNGIWVALKCLMKYDAIKVAFFVGEEIGCVGSSNADMSFFDDCRFVLQCDRRNGGDLITRCSYTELCSKEFVDAIHADEFGYKEADGLLTDVLTLKENGLDVSCVNISCGYYNPHTDEEFTYIPDLENCLAFVEHIIETCQDIYVHKHESSFYYGKYDGYYDWYGDDDYWYGGGADDGKNVEGMLYDEIYNALWDTPTLSASDLYSLFGTEYGASKKKIKKLRKDALEEIKMWKYEPIKTNDYGMD